MTDRTASTVAAAGGRGGKPTRLARSKAACAECHKAKQRCDGPPGPCHRCNTWGIECIFPSSAGPVPSAKAATSRASTPPTRGAKAAANAAIAPAPVQPAVASATPDVAEQLRLMNQRLESLESTLSRAQFAASASSSSSSAAAPQSHLHPPPHPGTPRLSSLNPSRAAAAGGGGGGGGGGSSSQTGSESSPMAGVTPASLANSAEQHQHHDVGVNAVETAGEAMAVEGLVDLLSGPGRNAGGGGAAAPSGPEQLGAWESVRQDVLGRGIMTLEECDQQFDFYFEHLQPWTCLLSTTLDRHPLVVRERSPLLFHAILLITLYYRPRSPGNIILYRAVSSILDSILAPQILCPQPDQLSFDFVRAIHLLLMYKPLQWAALNARGVSDPAQIESSSKMNVRASWILRLLVSRVSAFVGLPSIATTFAQAFANQNHTPIPDAIISQTRLFLGCVFHESHGALQSGKAANFIPQDACKVTRLFAALRKQSSDVRLAASVELVATASNALLARKEDGVLEDEDLRRFDDELDAWTEYWAPLLAVQAQPGAEGGQDLEAWSLFYPYASFTRLTVRGFAFNKWKAERKERAAQRAAMGGFVPPATAASSATLGAEERESIAKAVEVAEEIMCAVAVSPEGEALRMGRGRANGASVQEVWKSVGAGQLTPEPEVVKTLHWASDSLTCVMFSYPLIFLAKLANEGLLRSDLTVIPPGMPPLPPSPMSPNDKLCRLFQLGADLLDAIAPNPNHPSVKQAAFLRKVWDAGISGRRSVTSAPSSPKAGPVNGAHQPIPPHLSLGAAAGRLAQLPSPASIPPPHPSHTPQPPTFPPPPPQHQQGNFPSTIAANGSAAAALSSFPDFSLSTTYNPTPVHSPPFPPTGAGANGHSSATHPPLIPNGGAGGGNLAVADDPFAALLSGVSPSLFDGGAGGGFFSLDGGVDWPDLGASGGTPGPQGGAPAGAGGSLGLGGMPGLGGFGMQF
ncbi:hypothetical protein JCM6882_008920 [Rhodosporidiobolus microsporus]